MMKRHLLAAAAVALVACTPAEAPLPTSDARIEVHPRTPFGGVRKALYDFTSARYPAVRIELRAPEVAASGVAELYGRDLTTAVEKLVVVRVSSEDTLVDDIVTADAASLAAAAKTRAAGAADLAVVRVADDVPLATVVATLAVLRDNGFERVTLSAISPSDAPPAPKGDWLKELETCPRPDWMIDSVATLELHANGRGGVGSVTILGQDRPGAGHAGAMCVSTQPFPAHAGGSTVYRLRMRFHD